MLNYDIGKNFIEIFGKEDFNPEHILECGQIFSYKKTGENHIVLSGDKKAEILETESGYKILTDSPTYFENFFDLKTDYGKIKEELGKFEILQKPIEFGKGIRILKQDLFETLISFIVSANNNIKRIQLILNRMREKLGKNMGDYHAFPTQEQLLAVDEKFFKDIGAGYRDKYLYKVLRQTSEQELQSWQDLPTESLRRKLINLAGVGPKVADCILLFGYWKGNVFPVDTWIHQMYNRFYEKLGHREHIRKKLTEEFGMLSGYAQQYLFYYMRAEQ